MPDKKPRPDLGPSEPPMDAPPVSIHPGNAIARADAFRGAFQASVDRVMGRLSPALRPTAFVVGVPCSSSDGARSRSLPEGAASPRSLAQIDERIDGIDSAPDRVELALSRAEITAAAVADALRDQCRKGERASFCAAAVKTRSHYLIPVLELNRPAYTALPALRADPQNLRHGVYGFVETVVDAILRDAEEELLKPSPGKSLHWLDPDAIFRRAGTALLYEVAVAGHDVHDAHALLDRLNVISATYYERRASRGQIVIARPDHPSVRQKLRLATPIPLSEPVWARKLLETAQDELALLSDSSHIHGLGAVSDYDGDAEDLFVVKFVDHHKWELWHADTALMRVEYGVPGLAHKRLSREAFNAVLRRVFSETPAEVERRLFRIIEAAMDQPYGTMIVVSTRAEDEAIRLHSQGTRIEPVVLSDEMVRRVTAIDGALLLDGEGRCHAIGVILDGRATPDGKPSRGARYNSALRYVHGAGGATLAVVISEDGRVDLVPEG